MARQERTLCSQSHSCEFHQGHSLFLSGFTHRISKDHGFEGDTLSGGPKMSRQPLILPLVWEEGKNEGTIVNPSPYWSLLPGVGCERCL